MNTETAAEFTADHLTRMLYTEAGRMMLADAQAEAYRAELQHRRERA